METLKLIVEVIIGTLIGNIVARLCIKQPETKPRIPRMQNNALTRMTFDKIIKDMPEDAKENLKEFMNEDNVLQDAVLFSAGVPPEDIETMKRLLKDQVNKMK